MRPWWGNFERLQSAPAIARPYREPYRWSSARRSKRESAEAARNGQKADWVRLAESARSKAGSIGKVAAACGYSRTAVWHWLRGERMPLPGRKAEVEQKLREIAKGEA